MPALLVLAGEGIEAFVHDGVVAAALAGDVASHGVALRWWLVTVDVSWCASGAEHEWRISATGSPTVSSSNQVAAGIAAGAMASLYAWRQEPFPWRLVLRLGSNVLCIRVWVSRFVSPVQRSASLLLFMVVTKSGFERHVLVRCYDEQG